jgi:hypothetical protein
MAAFIHAHRDPPSARRQASRRRPACPLIYGDLGLPRRSPRRSPEFPSSDVPCRLAWRAEPMCCRLDSAGDKMNASRVLPMFPSRKTGRFTHEHVAAFEFSASDFEALARRERNI